MEYENFATETLDYEFELKVHSDTKPNQKIRKA